MHVVIIGNGIAGISAALRLRQNLPDSRITVVSGESAFHYARPSLMYIFMGHMTYRDCKPYEDHFWSSRRLELVRDWVTKIDTKQQRLLLHRSPELKYDKLLLATGSTPNKFGWPGQDLDGVQGLYGLQDLRSLYQTAERTRHAVIVGGGLIGLELAEMLHTRRIPVTMLVREASYWDNVLPREESALVNRVIQQSGIKLMLATNLERIEDDGAGRVAAAVVEGGERIACQFVGLTAGVHPNIELLGGTDIKTGRGVLVDASLRTSVENIYAAGDCAEIEQPGDTRNLLQQVWYTGKQQGQVVADVMAGQQRTYEPGIWYNSAKFLDLEYQVYGQVNLNIPGEQNLYWEHPNKQHSIRLVYKDNATIGVNVMGIRYRHAVCESWIRDERPVEWVVDNLDQANFDPEFFSHHEALAQASFREQLQEQPAHLQEQPAQLQEQPAHLQEQPAHLQEQEQPEQAQKQPEQLQKQSEHLS